jgi:Na+/melibiose symporter-like transporter
MIFKYGCASLAISLVFGCLNMHLLFNVFGLLGIALITASVVLLIGKFMP